ncbi:MAG: catalase family protein [Desulfobacterales bacterium]|nr:catalase family protein [Desulfobacterales bacterium]MBF0395194.1 catalase family protein [Desulfobacterales bacterium]
MEKLEIAQEHVYQDENTNIQNIIKLLKKKMDKDYSTGIMRRGAHPKHHGCVKAEFIVETNLSDELRVGIFKEASKYPAWIRFSNGSGEVQSDLKKDIRGIAIKVMNVEGKKLLEDEIDEKTQDFLLLSYPVLPIGIVSDFYKLIDAAINKHPLWFFLNPFSLHLREIKLFIDAARQHTNPLDIPYWSTTPYMFGTKAVKYSIKPTSNNLKEMPVNPSGNYLCEIMKQQLKETEASFDFMVQFQTNPVEMPIEDASILWDESHSSFQKVATIKIPPQQFDSEKQMDFCENLSFTPWHSLPEHKPLGGINRARKEIYRELSKYRHQKNNISRKEPTKCEL